MAPVIFGISVCILFFLALLVGSVAWTFYRNPELHIWPSVTRCRICEKRVYVWQKQEYRTYRVKIENPDGLPEERLARISASGIVHARCPGNPEVTFTARRG